jgi:uncharacterized protein involved in outer membrane biogenesis
MRWKRFVAIGVLTIVILMAVVYVYLNTFDYNKLRPLVAQMVEDATGRKLNLGGDVNLEIGFTPTLVVTNVALANVSWGSQPQMIEIEKLQARVRLLSLLVRDLDIKYIRLVGVKVLLETGPKDQENWDFLAESSSAGSIGAFKPTAVDVKQVKIENLHLTYRENRTGSPTQFTLSSLELNRQENEDALALILKADINGQPLTLSGKTGRIRDIFGHQRCPLQLSGKLANAAVKINGAIDDVLTLQGIDVDAQLNGQNLADFGEVIEEKLPATDQYEIQGHLSGSTAALTMKNAQGSARRGGLHFTVNGVVKDILTLGGMDLQSQLSGKSLAEFGEVIEEKLPATDEFEIKGQLKGSTDVLALQKAQGSARRGSMRLSLSGAVKDLLTLRGMDLQSRLKGKELAEIGLLFGTKLPGLGPFDISGKLAGPAKALSLNEVSATVDKSDFSGLAKFELLKRPKITIRLESSVIDFTTLMKSLEQDEQKTANKDQQKRRLFSNDPLPLEGLKKVNADIVLKAKNIHARDARIKFGNMTLKLEDSDFSIKKFEATYKQTKISGDLHTNHGSPTRVATKFLVQNFDLGSFFKETGINDQVQATVDIAAHLDSKGDSVRSLMANLDGAIGAVMGEGYLTKYLDLLSVNLTSKVVPFWGHLQNARQIKCAVVQFDIKSGVAASQAFVFNTRAGILAGEGEINLDTEQINFLLVPELDHPSLSLSTKLRVNGAIMDPKVSPDKAALLTKGAKLLSTLAVGPLGLLAPFVHLGAIQKHPCDIQSIGQLGLNIPADE